MRLSHRFAPLLILVALTVSGCLHLVQPQTYYLDTEHTRLQVHEYLLKDLVTGLPEPLFQRWYTRTDAWKDDLRPYILGQYEEDGRTVYKVGSGVRTIAKIYFKDGRLDEVGSWGLMQQPFVSAWTWHEHPLEIKMEEGMLERFEALDPLSDALVLDEHSARGRVCEFEPGTEYEALEPLYLHDCGPPTRCLTTSHLLPPDPEEGPVLPAGAKLIVERHGVAVGSVRAPEQQDKRYHVSFNGDLHGLCPAGVCPHVGEEALLGHDLMVVRDEHDHAVGSPPVAFVAGQIRTPVWAERLGMVPAGTRVRIQEWEPCHPLNRVYPLFKSALIEILDPNSGSYPSILPVLFAPPGFFKPIAAGDVSGSAESLIK